MPRKNRTPRRVPNKTIEVENNFEETKEILQAIHQGRVDALLVKHPDGTQVVTFSNAEFPYRLMVESMNEGAVTLIPDGTIFYCNSRFSEMVEIESDHLTGSQFRDLILPEEQEDFEALFVNTRKQGTRGEFCLKKSQGDCIPVLLSIYPLGTEPVTGISILVTDMTERKRAEDALHKSESLFRLIATNSPDVIFAQDRNLRYTWIINPTSPLRIDQIIGKTDWDLLPPQEAQRLTDLKQKILASGVSVREELALSRSGNQRWFDAIYQPLHDHTQQIIGLLCYARDITERVQSEEKIRILASQLTLAEQEERQRISQLLHDDLQQRLFAIKAQLSTLNRVFFKDQSSPQVDFNLDEVQASLSEAINSTRNLSIDLSPVIRPKEDLIEAIKWLASRMLEQHGLQVEVKAEGNWDLLESHARMLVFQSVSELLFNVVKHAGTSAATVTLEEKAQRGSITVSDGGKGFDVKKIINDPGAAHGLLMVRDRLSLIGCRMDITSSANKGTHIVIEIPMERKLT